MILPMTLFLLLLKFSKRYIFVSFCYRSMAKVSVHFFFNNCMSTIVVPEARLYIYLSRI